MSTQISAPIWRGIPQNFEKLNPFNQTFYEEEP